VKRAAEVEVKKDAEKTKPSTPEDDELRSLKERLQALRAKKKQKQGDKQPRPKRLKREELAVKTLRAHPEGGILGELAEELDVRWQKQGKPSNPRAATYQIKRLAKAGVLFGLLKLEGKRVTWLNIE